MLPLIILISILVFVLLFLFAVRSYPIPLASKSRILLLIAHPDDETMFFSPTIRALTHAGHRVFVLCVSNGDFDGLVSKNVKKKRKKAKNALVLSFTEANLQ